MKCKNFGRKTGRKILDLNLDKKTLLHFYTLYYAYVTAKCYNSECDVGESCAAYAQQL